MSKLTLPPPFTVKVPVEPEYVALPIDVTAPISWLSHGLGKGLEVTVKSMGLLSFMLGAKETTKYPEAEGAPVGTMMVMDVLFQEPTGASRSFRNTAL
jgi:hypothetical protein